MDPKIFIKTVPNPPKVNKTKIFIGLSVAVMLFAIPLGVYLVSQRTNLLPKAISEPVEIEPSPEPNELFSPSPRASQSASASAQVLKGDGNSDGKIEFVDLSILLTNWQTTKNEVDFNDDGVINSFDFASMVNLLKEKNLVTGT